MAATRDGGTTIDGYSHALAVLMLAGLSFDEMPAYGQVKTAADGVHLALSSQTGWQGEHGWCTLSAEIVQDRGGLS